MKILDRYIAKILLTYTLGVMAIWVGVYALFDFINEVDLIGQQNYTIVSAIIYVLADLPAVIYAHSSVIILLGCLLGLGHLATTSQLIIVQGSGLSIMQIVKKVVAIALIFIFAVLLLGELVAPITTKYAASYKSQALGRGVASVNQQDFWLKNGGTIINVKKNFDGSIFGGVTLIKINDKHQLDSVFYADKAVFNGGNLALKKTEHYQLKLNGKLTDIQTKHYQHYNTELFFEQKMVNALKQEPEELSSWALYKHKVFLDNNNLTSEAFEVELYKRLVKPITLVAMLMMAMLFIFGSLRDSTLGKKIFLGVIISLFFELASRIGGVISLRFDYDPLFSASAPTLVALGVAFYLLRKKSLET
ncbi:MAG: LPS export ABC transporter permease LptG [Gammaproteobacteria bacterium]|nr:LPS export ABC transporter permease LptG [Gammaproteobacteria bacterium]